MWCDLYIYMYNMMKYCKYDLINRIQWVCVIYRSMCDWIVLMISGMSVAAKFEELQQQALKRLSDKDQNCQGSICSMVFFCCCCCFCCFGGGWNHCKFHTCFHIESFGGEWEVGMARCMRVFERIQLQTIHDIACQLPMISLFLVVKKCCRQCQDRSIQSIHQTWIVGILDLSNWQL